MRKVHVKVTVDLCIKADEDIETSEILYGLEYNFKDTTGKAKVESWIMRSAEVKDD